MASSAQIVTEYLVTAGTSLYTLCGTRVWSPIPLKGWVNTTACILYNVAVDTPVPSETTDRRSMFRFRCFGGSTSFGDAVAVYSALAARLHNCINTTTTSGRIVGAWQVLASYPLVDEEEGWPYALAEYDISTI